MNVRNLFIHYGMIAPHNEMPMIGDNPLTKAWVASGLDISFWEWCLEESQRIQQLVQHKKKFESCEKSY